MVCCIIFRVYNLLVADIMKTNLYYVSYHSKYADLKALLEKSDLHSYPLVDSEGTLHASSCLIKPIKVITLLSDVEFWGVHPIPVNCCKPYVRHPLFPLFIFFHTSIYFLQRQKSFLFFLAKMAKFIPCTTSYHQQFNKP